jgi:hypothetical protein
MHPVGVKDFIGVLSLDPTIARLDGANTFRPSSWRASHQVVTVPT